MADLLDEDAEVRSHLAALGPAALAELLMDLEDEQSEVARVVLVDGLQRAGVGERRRAIGHVGLRKAIGC
jgi:hypothetical protein